MAILFTSRGAQVNCAIMAMLYTHSIGNQLWNTMVVFKMRDSVPSARYSPVCNVLRQWKTSLIPIYRVYRLDDKCAAGRRSERGLGNGGGGWSGAFSHGGGEGLCRTFSHGGGE